jgi:uncharacterized protein
MIIDFHCHAGQGDKMSAPWNTSAPIENYLRRARAAGIDKTVVMPPLHGNYQQANAQVAQIVARYPARLIGFAFVHARRDAGRIFRMIQHAVTKWRFRGMKVHGFEAMPTREVCDTALAFNLPVLVDIVSRPEVVDMFAREFPRVNFIIAHLGSFTDNWNAHQQVIYQLARYPNVYADTSGVRQFDYLLQAVRRGGPHKLLFGSDGPWLHPGMELFKIRLLGLPAEQEALVLGRNAIRLLRRAGIDENSQVSFSQEAKRIQSLWSGVNSAQSELRYESHPVASEYRL